MKLKHYCRNKHCRNKLSVPVENGHHAFCAPGCHSSFYHSRCLVCEEPMRRKGDHQRFGSGHTRCKAEYHRFPRVYDWPEEAKRLQTSQGTGAVREGGRSADKMGVQKARLSDPTSASEEPAAVRGWFWQSDPLEYRLVGRNGERVAVIEASVGKRWRVAIPETKPVLSAPDLDSGRLAISMALGSLPLDETTATRLARGDADRIPYLPRRSDVGGSPWAVASRWQPTGRGADMPDIPGFLLREPEERLARAA